MFANAIELVEKFTRPIKFITRNYKDTNVIPGAATLSFSHVSIILCVCRQGHRFTVPFLYKKALGINSEGFNYPYEH